MRTLICSALILIFCVQLHAKDDQWFKGNLHTHSLWSDGDHFPDSITKWYADRDYQFLAMTDHNVLSNSERWLPLKVAKERGGENILNKYQTEFDESWVETRKDDEGNLEVRLKRLDEYRQRFEKPGKFLLLTGEEISDRYQKFPIHMNAINLAERLQPAGGQSVSDTIKNNLRSTRDQASRTNRKILIFLNHPNFGWAVTAEDLAVVTEQRFFEVYNGHPGINHLGDKKRASVERIWDVANTIRISRLKSPPLMGLGTDDCHYYHGRAGSQPGRGWISVRAKQLDANSLMEAIERGDFYASSGVSFTTMQYTPKNKTLSLEMPAIKDVVYTTRFIGTLKNYDQSTQKQVDDDGKSIRTTKIYSPDVGRVLAEVTGNEATYQLTGNELYVRAVVTSSVDHPNPSFTNQKKQAWTQPVGWENHIK